MCPCFSRQQKKKKHGGGHHPTTKPARAAFTPFLTHLLPPPFPGAEQQAKLGESAQGFAATFKEEVRAKREKDGPGNGGEKGEGAGRGAPASTLSLSHTHAICSPPSPQLKKGLDEIAKQQGPPRPPPR